VAILTESSSSIELLLKSALQKENLNFLEQQRIYESPSDLHPKYVADFVVMHESTVIIVECDGASYHSSDFDVDRDIQRDRWLESRGYKKVLHFTAYQLQYEMKTVILNIKCNLGIVHASKKQLQFRGKSIQKKPIVNIKKSSVDLHKVSLFYNYIQLNDRVWLVYKFKDHTLNRFSEERIRVFYNVPEKLGHQLSILAALLDLKKSVELTVFCSSSWLTAYLNRLVESNDKNQFLLKKIRQELSNHNYLCTYINTHRDFHYYDAPSAERLIIHELYSRCRQLRHGKYTHESNIDAIDFQSFKSSILSH